MFSLLSLFWMAVFNIGLQVIGSLLRPHPSSNAPQPASLGDFRIPTAEEGRAIPIAWGTVKVGGANCVWWGDLGTQSIKKSIGGGIFDPGPKHAWVGFRYSMGEQLVLCMGPIDEIVDIRFDDKSVGGGVIQVVDGENALVFGNVPPPWFTATIPPGPYTTPHALAIATEDAMIAAYGGGTWKVVYGYHCIPGHSDKFSYRIEFATGSPNELRTFYVPGAFANGVEFAAAWTAAARIAEASGARARAVTVTMNYLPEAERFVVHFTKLAAHDATGVGMIDNGEYAENGYPHIGFQMGTAFEEPWDGDELYLTSDFPTSPSRYMFAFGGFAGKLDLDPANGTTCQQLFGLALTGEPLLQQYMAIADRISPQFVSSSVDGSETTFVINAPDLFGGDDREGGIMGVIRIYVGNDAQVANAYLQNALGVDLPAYRKVCYAVFEHLYIGTQPYPKDPAFIIRRTPNPLALTGGHENIAGDANPACMLYELLTDPHWGLGIAAGSIDSAAFTAVAETLFAETLGLSMLVDSRTQALDLMGEILRHVDGVIFAEPSTGKLSIRLARPDYDAGDLDTFGPDAVTVTEFSRPSWDELRNVARVRYVDRASNYTERIAQAHNSATWAARGGDMAVEQVDFRGFSNPTAAQVAVERVLRTVGYPLAAIRMTANRTAHALRPGSVAKLDWPRLGITGLVFRVTRIETGDPRKGEIIVDAVEDIFGVATTIFTPPSTSAWEDPAIAPMALEDQRIEEAPYAWVAGEDIRVITLAGTGPLGNMSGYEVWSDPAGGDTYTETQDVGTFTPAALLATAVSPTATSLVLDAGVDLNRLSSIDGTAFAAGANLLLIDNEWVAWQTITDNGDGTWTIAGLARGVMDSTPRPHGGGARAWFATDASGYTADDPYVADVVLGAKLLPYNAAATMALGRGVLLLLSTRSRALRPYVPTAVQLNTDDYPATLTGDAVISWAHRDRLDTWSYADSGQTAARETATHYRVKVYGDGGTLKHTEDNLTGTTWTYTAATEMAENGGNLNDTLRFVLESVQDAGDELVSQQAYDWTVTRV